MKLFSVDDHLVEPPNLWSSRLPAEYRESAPHVVNVDGVDYWRYEDKTTPVLAAMAAVGIPEDEWDQSPINFADMRPACYDPKERVKDIVSEGMTASVCFPTLPRFSGVLLSQFKDKNLAELCVKAWNDYLFEEWCAAAPEVFVPMVILPLWDPKLAAKELERNLDRGARAITLPEETSMLGLPSYYTDFWDPIFARCQEADIPVCMHIGSSGWKPFVAAESTSASLPIALGFVPTITHAVNMMYGPVPRKFPEIKLVYSEGGIGWVPVTLERADARYTLHKHYGGDDDLLPSEVCKRNMWFCMMPDEHYGLKNRHEVGIDKIFWEADYPHANCPFPGTQKEADEFFDGVPEDDVRLIAYENAERIFKWRCHDPEEIALAGVTV